MNTLYYYVAPDGNDANPGTLEQPFATLQRARDAARAVREHVPTDLKWRDQTQTGRNADLLITEPPMPERPAVTIRLRGGAYRLQEPLSLSATDGGTREHPVLWEAYEDEVPVVKGSVTVTGWEEWKDGIWRAPLPDGVNRHFTTRELFYRGQRQTRSRYPKFDPDNPRRGGFAFPSVIPEEERYAAFMLPTDWPRRYAHPDEGEVNIFGGHGGWCNAIIPVRAIDTDSGLVCLEHPPIQLAWIPWNMDTPLTTNSRFCVENMVEDVTEAGEWCLVHAERMCYFKPPTDAPFDPSAVELPVLGQLIALEGAQHVTFRGITVTQCRLLGDNYHRTGNSGYGAMMPQPDWTYVGEAVHVKWCAHIAFEGCTFDQLGGNALYFERKNRRHRISRCTFSHVGCNPVVFIGDRVDHPLFCRVEDCHIHDGGDLLNYVAGVFCGVSDGITIAHNHIHDMPHHAVNLATNGLGRNYVEYNRIERVTLEIADTGAINMWMDDAGTPGEPTNPHGERSGHVIRNNWIAHVQGCIGRDGQVVDDETARGIYLDDGTSNCVVMDNIIVDVAVGLQIHAGRHNLIENNIIIDALAALLLCNDPTNRRGSGFTRDMMRGHRFARNLVVSRHHRYPHFWAPEDQHTRGTLYWFTQPSFSVADTFEYCDDNLFWYPHADGLRVDIHLPPPFVDNVWMSRISLAEWREQYVHDLASLTVDPSFADIDAGDFTLAPDSPALALGFRPIAVDHIGTRDA